MAPAASRQSTRTTRRKAPVVEDSDNEENRTPSPEIKEDEEEFTPAPAPLKTGRGRGRPRKSVAPLVEPAAEEVATSIAAPKKRGRPKRATEVAEPTQTETPPESSPRLTAVAKIVPKKRGRKPRVSVEKDTIDEGEHTLTRHIAVTNTESKSSTAVESEYEAKESSVTPAPETEPSEAGDRTPRAAQTPAFDEETPRAGTAVKRQRIEVVVKAEPIEDNTIRSNVEEETIVAEPAAEANVPVAKLKPSETPEADRKSVV